MPAVHEGDATLKDPDELKLDLLEREAIELSAMANRYNSDSLKSSQASGYGKAKSLSTEEVLGKLTPEQIKDFYRYRAEDQERRAADTLALKAEHKKQAAIGAEMLRQERKSSFSFSKRPTPNNLRFKLKIFGLYLVFQGATFALKVKRFFKKLFS